MFCSRCGRTLPPNAKSCPFCGSPVDDSRYCQFCDETTHYDSSTEPETICRSCGEMLGAGSLGGYCRSCLKDPKTYQKAQERVQLQKSAASRARNSDQGRVKTALEHFSQAAEQARPRTFRSRTTSSSWDASAKKGSPRGCLVAIVFLMIFLPMLVTVGQVVFQLAVGSSSSPRPEPAASAPAYSTPAPSPSDSLLDDPDYRQESVYSVAEMEMESDFTAYTYPDAQFLSIDFDDSQYEEDFGYLWCGGDIRYIRDGSQYQGPFTLCIMLSEDSYYVVYFAFEGNTFFDLRPIVDSFGRITYEGADSLDGYEAGDPVYDLDDPIYIVY